MHHNYATISATSVKIIGNVARGALNQAENLVKDTHSLSLDWSVINEEKSFVKLTPGVNFTKLFYIRNLRMVAISSIVCHWQAFQAWFNVCGEGQWPT
jgi:hypothetical protein